MSVCQSCGAELVPDTRLCESCGPTIELGTNDSASAVEIPAGAAVVSPSGETGSKTMDTNLAAALAYLAGFVTGITFLVLNPYKSNSFVRFHAFQSIFFNAAWVGFWIIWIILSTVLTRWATGIFRLMMSPILLTFTFAGFAVWILLMYQAYQQKLFGLPILGKFAAQRAGVRL